MSDLSPLEEKFPRLAQKIVASWGTYACFDELQDLLLDRRGGRQGFPPDVYADLFLLQLLVPHPKVHHDVWSDAVKGKK
ncbi:MAG: hypothetical protein M0Z73_02760 [Betaproteobacteria bacterium]|nr:hypothetical protein [Betaproteobacteria bacterium]